MSETAKISDEGSELYGKKLADLEGDDYSNFVLLPAALNDGFGSLVRIRREDIKREQDLDSTLKEVSEKARNKKSHYEVMNTLVFRKTFYNRGGERLQMVVPLKFRLGILGACQEGISSHLGEMKTKGKV